LLWRYILRRGLTIIPVLFGISVLVFSFIRLIPGDPAVAMLGERATEESVAMVRANLGLDRPITEQYLLYIGKVLRGDLGKSILRGDSVATEIKRRFPATLELAAAAMFVALLIGIPIGIVSATRRNSLIDNASRMLSLVGVSMPVFWLGLMMAWFFGVQLHLLPTSGRLDIDSTIEPIRIFGHEFRTNLYLVDSLLTGNMRAFGQSLLHLILPALALATIPLAIIARMTRSSLLDVLNQDYVRTAHAKGLRSSVVVTRHALRNALLPIVTVVGLQVGRLLGGAILTETIFSWPGLGTWAFEAIQARDYPVVQAMTLFIATIFVLVNLAVDILYTVVDPRVRFD
jgi:peptide/nickel transport system permease protein